MDQQQLRERADDYIRKETDQTFRAEVEALLAKEDWKELEDRFYRDLEFGTAGLRGVIGGGFNRINSFVVKRATQGLANYLVAHVKGKQLSAGIAYDSRRYSAAFSEAAALVLAANGIKTYLFSALRPTPELSFAVRHLGLDTGIVVTASHNPPKYNGYKVFWSNGAQIVEPHDTGIINEVNSVADVKSMSREEAISAGLLVIIDREIDIPYADMVRSYLFRPELFKQLGSEVKIVYTPLHGTGAFHVEGILGGLGLKVYTVPEQREPDGNFPTTDYPNPEDAAALELALKLAEKIGADVVLGTDPDADRLGTAVPDASGKMRLITGNQFGVLLADYILLSHKERGTLPKKPALINTVVSSGMLRVVAESYGAENFQCLTGFKWIADVWNRCETDGRGYVPLMGCEESYGYLIEKEVRDKDAVSAAAMAAEMTLYWRSQGKSLLDRLDELYKAHGYWQEIGIGKYFPGVDGVDKMKKIMADYRANPPRTLGGIVVEKVRDIQEGVWKFPADPSRKEPVDLPKSNVLQFYLADGTIVSARPSGTEPKIKFYATCCADAKQGIDAARAEVASKLKAIEADLRSVIGN